MIDPQKILEKFPDPVPRYTSYPTAPHFTDGLGPQLIREALASITPEERISIYVHVPFCDRMCWFCGCHTKQTNRYDPVAAYMESLRSEVALLGAEQNFRPKVGHLHFGGGSPSMVCEENYARLRASLETEFEIDAETEISVEVDPNDLNGDTLAGLKALGLTRASIGVQDFDPAVQAAINRPQSFGDTKNVVEQLRATGIHSLNIDALYGLPLQSEATIAKTIDQVISLSPDRVALFGYAHVPWMKKHQQLIREDDLPDTMARFRQAEIAEQALLAAGYHKIGFDHFAKPDDSMAVAERAGHLHRNFQGYTTDDCQTMLGLGASSIGRYRGGYVQNIVATGQYKAAIERGELPVAKGFRLNRDDDIRAFMIERLMCDFAISAASLRSEFGAEAEPYIDEMQHIALMEQDGLCAMEHGVFSVPRPTQTFVRIIASRFDAYLPGSQFRYSKAV